MKLGDCIVEEGEAGQGATAPEERAGWRVLRESIKQKEFHETLTVRKSTLKLHNMDEVAFTRHSQLSGRFSISSMTPPNRKSQRGIGGGVEFSNESVSPLRNKYGYAETNVATHRRKSIAGGARRNSSIVSELDNEDSDLMQV